MLGRKIKLYRLQQGLTKKELAAKAGITPARITALENGIDTQMEAKDVKIVSSIASALNVSESRLLSYIPQRPNSNWKSARSYLDVLMEEYLDKLYLLSDLLGDKEVADKTVTRPFEADALLEQLVLRALDEDKISWSRGAELLGISPFEMKEKAATAKGLPTELIS